MTVRRYLRTLELLCLTVMLLFVAVFSAGAMMNAYAADAAAAVSELPVPPDSAVLKKGDNNDQVKWLQAALNAVTGSELTVDGDFGGKTETALKTYQESAGLPVTGIADGETVSALTKALGIDTEQPEPEKEEKRITGDGTVKSAFAGYWKAYFKTLFGSIFHFDVSIKLLAEGVAGVLLLTLELLFCGAILIFILGIFLTPVSTIRDYSGNISAVFVGRGPNMGGAFGVLKFIALIFIVLSPLFLDLLYINYNFGLKGVKLVAVAVVMMLLRLLLGAALYFAVFYIVLTLISFVWALVRFIINSVISGFEYIISLGKDGYFTSPASLFEAMFKGRRARLAAKVAGGLFFILINLNSMVMFLEKLNEG